MFESKIYNSIMQVEKKSWDSLCTDNVFMCYNWLKTFEESTRLPLQPNYILIFNEERLFAVSVCYVEKQNGLSSINSALLGRLKNFSFAKNFSFIPAVICGPPNGYGSHFVISKETNSNQYPLIQDMIVDSVEDIAIRNNASVFFRNVMGYEKDLISLLTRRKYYKTVNLPLNYIDIKWSSFNEYRISLSEKHPSMKKSIPRQINKNRKSGVIIKKLTSIDGQQQRLFELIEMNHLKYKNPITLKPDFLERVNENFGNDAAIYIAVKEDKIIGINVELKKDKEAFIANVGIDHNRAQNDLTYFNLMFYEPIKDAIAEGLKRIYYGNSLYKTKSRRGCNIDDTYIFFLSSMSKRKFVLRTWFAFHRFWMKRKFSYIKRIQIKYN
jgi:predicted N-acyltransferase